MGVKAVIAKSFAFIYQRNQPALGLLGFTISDEDFYETARDGEDIAIDVPSRRVTIAGRDFPFVLSDLEYNLTTNKGLSESFKKYGRGIWSNLTRTGSQTEHKEEVQPEISHPDRRLNW